MFRRNSSFLFLVVIVQLLSCVQLFATPWTVALQAPLSFIISWSLPRLVSIELVMPYKHLILCHSLLLLPSIFPSIRIFSSESTLHIRWPDHWSFSFSISPSVNIQSWFPLGLTGLVFLPSKRLSRVFNSTIWKHQFFNFSLLYGPMLTSVHLISHICTFLVLVESKVPHFKSRSKRIKPAVFTE